MRIRLTFTEEAFLNLFTRTHKFDSREQAIRYMICREMDKVYDKLKNKKEPSETDFLLASDLDMRAMFTMFDAEDKVNYLPPMGSMTISMTIPKEYLNPKETKKEGKAKHE
jgi:hypothetical protein